MAKWKVLLLSASPSCQMRYLYLHRQHFEIVFSTIGVSVYQLSLITIYVFNSVTSNYLQRRVEGTQVVYVMKTYRSLTLIILLCGYVTICENRHLSPNTKPPTREGALYVLPRGGLCGFVLILIAINIDTRIEFPWGRCI